MGIGSWKKGRGDGGMMVGGVGEGRGRRCIKGGEGRAREMG